MSHHVTFSKTGRKLMTRQGGCRDAIHPDWRDDPEQLLEIVEKRIRELKRDRDHLREILDKTPPDLVGSRGANLGR